MLSRVQPLVKYFRASYLAPILLLALVLRLGLFINALPSPERFLYNPDSYEYDRLAQNLLAGHGFTQSQSAPFAPELNRTPLYPTTLAILYLVTNHSHAAAILFNIVLGVCGVALTYGVAHKTFGSSTAIGASLFVATDLTTITYNNLLLTEVSFTVLLLVGILFLARYLLRPSSPYAFASGLSLGLATLCRPIGIYLAPVLLPLFVWSGGVTGRLQSGRNFLILNAGCFLLVGAWLARNYLTFGTVDVSSVAAINLYFHRAAAVQALLENTDPASVRARWEQEFATQSVNWSEEEKIAWLNARAIDIIAQHPQAYALVYSEGLLRMFGPERDSLADLLGWTHTSFEAALGYAVGWVQLLPVYTLSALGFLASVRDPRQRTGAFLLLLLTAYFVVTAGPEAYPRFRVPFMPFISIFAGRGFTFNRAALKMWQARA
jgi:4-amino-4-deoxy-L-arabinose transferase-like glycosyltransferase